jgi:hypothetical protein
MKYYRPSIGLLLILSLSLASCRSSPTLFKVTGRLTKGGRPLKVQPNVGRLEVLFYPVTDNPEELVDPYEVGIDLETGTFEVPGKDRKGIPAGKYRVCVVWMDDGMNDKLKGQFSLEKPSPIIREVTGDVNLEIDLDKPKS